MAPGPTFAIFGAGTKTHHTQSQWVLESPAANLLQLRRTAVDTCASPTVPCYQVYSMVYPACSASPTGPHDTKQLNMFSITLGDTVQGTFCGEGSVILVSVFDEGTFPQRMTQFRCQRLASNSNLCQRVF